MTNPCKCKSESERMVKCCRKLGETFHTLDCWAVIHASARKLKPTYVMFYSGYELGAGTEFESVDAFEAWANSICDNPHREIIHRRFKL